jgi:predicted tellurium resistance membrane protein TerC
LGQHGLPVWLGFTGLVVALLVLDLGVLNRRSHVLSFKEAMSWSLGLIAFALLFGGFLWWREGWQHALEYYTGYLIELSLRFEWIIYVFGGILILTGLKMLRQKEERVELEKNPVVRIARRLLPFSRSFDGVNFFTRTGTGRLLATPLLLVLIVVEWSDLVFAIDSIPAIFAVTRDPFLVYSSNVFAILGLRALYFVLAGMMDKFIYLKPGVALILIFVGGKMASSAWLHPPTYVSLLVIVGTLVGAVGLSLVRRDSAARAA